MKGLTKQTPKSGPQRTVTSFVRAHWLLRSILFESHLNSPTLGPFEPKKKGFEVTTPVWVSLEPGNLSGIITIFTVLWFDYPDDSE